MLHWVKENSKVQDNSLYFISIIRVLIKCYMLLSIPDVEDKITVINVKMN